MDCGDNGLMWHHAYGCDPRSHCIDRQATHDIFQNGLRYRNGHAVTYHCGRCRKKFLHIPVRGGGQGPSSIRNKAKYIENECGGSAEGIEFWHQCLAELRQVETVAWELVDSGSDAEAEVAARRGYDQTEPTTTEEEEDENKEEEKIETAAISAHYLIEEVEETLQILECAIAAGRAKIYRRIEQLQGLAELADRQLLPSSGG